MTYRHDSQFIDPRSIQAPLTRDQRAAILYVAERLELRTKAAGRASGCLGQTGLQLLRVLLTFAGPKGCFPSYDQLRMRTGFSRSTIAKRLRALNAVGLVRIVHRIVRRQVQRVNGWTGLVESYVGCFQTSNAYGFAVEGVIMPARELLPVDRILPATRVQSTDERTRIGFRWHEHFAVHGMGTSG
jgi:hypothetical protein